MAATAKFNAENKDPKAQIITTLNTMANTGTLLAVEIFYDGPTKPPIFDVFDNITVVFSTVAANRTFSSFVKSIPLELNTDFRGAFASFSTTDLTESFLVAVKTEYQVGAFSMLRM